MKPLVPGQYVEQGVASWYGVPFHGHRTSNGEIYDMYQFTAAHRTLPFDSLVRVTNLRNGKRTEVRINDRGPFVANRIIDLSLAAARALDMVGTGTAPVKIELLSGPSPQAGFFAVQVGAFSLRENAERLRARLLARYGAIAIEQYDSATGILFRVRVGRLPNEEAARQMAEQLLVSDQLPGFVVRLDQ
jgi:peptidoglycan lytic transglycosylase